MNCNTTHYRANSSSVPGDPTDYSLLARVRQTITTSEDVLCCVAFVQSKGVHLIQKELEAAQAARARARLLATTVFQSSEASALDALIRLGADVRVINPGSGQTYHPKLYLGRQGQNARAVIGSANLTGGLATNVEVAVALEGTTADAPLTRAIEWAEGLWADPRAEPWKPGRTPTVEREHLYPELWAMIEAERQRDPVFQTLGPKPRPNRVVEVTPSGVLVETKKSLAERGGASEVPAWMLNLAWDRLKTHGSLTNIMLLNDLRVHRSSAVCAILARLPGVERWSGHGIELRLCGGRV